MEQEVQLPTKAGLEAQVQELLLKRADLKDKIESIEKQLPVVSSLLQLLTVQEAHAEAQKAGIKD